MANEFLDINGLAHFKDKIDQAHTQELDTALAGKQDVIQDLESIRAGASAGATAYQKPSGGIPSSDMSEAVRTSLGKADTALQSFTETDPTVPAWAKADNPPTEIFWATYGVTTAAEIREAISAGKLPVCEYNGRTYIFSGDLVGSPSYNFLWFMSVQNDQSFYLRVRSDTNGWGWGYVNFERTANRVNTISGNESATNKYPSTKAVVDYVAENKELFVATPNVTTFSEIQAAVSTGKAIIAIHNNGTVYTLSSITSSFCYFSNINRTTAQYYIVQPSGWSPGQGALELAEKRVSSWRTTPDNTHYPSEKLVKDSLDAKQPTIDSSHKLDYGLLSNTPTIPDAVEPNPTVPSGTTPTSLTGLKIGSGYYDIDAGGGTVTDVTVGGTSVVSGGVAAIPAIPTVEALTSNEIDTIWNTAMA